MGAAPLQVMGILGGGALGGGELAALGAALLWAIAIICYGRLGVSLSPFLLNVIKGVLSTPWMVATLLITQGAVLGSLDVRAAIILSLTGVLGIGLGDTAFLTALRYLGARQVLLLESLIPVLTALLAAIALGELLSARTWFGIVIAVVGVTWVVTEPPPVSGSAVIAGDRDSSQSPRQAPVRDPSQAHPHAADPPAVARSPRFALSRAQIIGLGFGLLAILAQAISSVAGRGILSGSAIVPLDAAVMRLAVGSLVPLLWLVRSPRAVQATRWELGHKLGRSRRRWGLLIIAAVFGTYGGLTLQQTALKFAPAGIVQALMSTSPLFGLAIDRALGDRLSGRSVMGALIAVAGVILLLSGR
jgi:drug/metabolite transporter (DMT)-like permease